MNPYITYLADDGATFGFAIKQCLIELNHHHHKIFILEVVDDERDYSLLRIAELEEEIKRLRYLESIEPKNEIEKYI